MQLRLALSACTLLAAVVMLISCGKKEEGGSKDNPGWGVEPEKPLPEAEKEKVFCDPDSECPGFIAKIMVLSPQGKTFCTGTLVSENKLVTSASCLPRHLRSPGVSCSEDIYIFFEKHSNGTPEVVRCKSIELTTQVEGDPMFWRGDVAYLELKKSQHWRRRLAISRSGLPDGKDLTQYYVEQVDEHTGYIRQRTCKSVFSSYINPLANHESSPNMLMSGCEFKNGSSGSPILDSMDRIRGLVSRDLTPEHRSSLENSGYLTEGLGSVGFASNFSCAPLLNEEARQDERECAKPLNMESVNIERQKLMDPQVLFASSLEKARDSISSNDFVDFGVRLIPFEKHFVPEIYPVCFKNTSFWLWRIRKEEVRKFTVTFTPATWTKMIGKDGKARAAETLEPRTTVSLTFNPKDLYARKKTDMKVGSGPGVAVYDELPVCE